MNYQEICKQTIEIAQKAGKYIRSERGKIKIDEIKSKGKHNFVTKVDKASEQFIVQELGKILPTSGFIAEEGTSNKKGDRYNWVIDPLDGTTNFIHGSPPVAVSIALMEDNNVVAGVVYELFLDECFYAWKGSDAFLNGRKIEVSKTAGLNNCLIATGFPYSNFDRMKSFMDSLAFFFTNTHGVRRLGSAATDLAYVACGRYDGFYEYNLNPWDVAAGAFIVQQAGGKNADFKGTADYLFGREIVSANKNSFEEFRAKVGDFMKP